MKANLDRFRAVRAVVFAGVALAMAGTGFAATNLVSLVPEKAVVVGMVKVQDLRTSPLTGRLFDHTDQISTDGEARQFLEDAGLDPARDIDTVLIAVSPRANDAKNGDVLMAAEGRFIPDRLAAAVVKKGALPQSASGLTYYLLPKSDTDKSATTGAPTDDRRAAVAFVSSKLAFVGTEQAVIDALAAYKSGGTSFLSAAPIGREMALIEPSATAWLLIDVQRASRLSDSPQTNLGKNNQFGLALKHVSTIAVWGKDTGDAIKFSATALTVDADTRDLLQDTLKGITAAWRLALQDKAPEWIPVIRAFSIEKSGDGVTMSGSIPASLILKQASRVASAKE